MRRPTRDNSSRSFRSAECGPNRDLAPLKAVKEWVATFEAFWDDGLARLKRQVESEP